MLNGTDRSPTKSVDKNKKKKQKTQSELQPILLGISAKKNRFQRPHNSGAGATLTIV